MWCDHEPKHRQGAQLFYEVLTMVVVMRIMMQSAGTISREDRKVDTAGRQQHVVVNDPAE